MAKENKDPLVTVIIYIGANSIDFSSCFDSILKQTYRKIELVVVTAKKNKIARNKLRSYKSKNKNIVEVLCDSSVGVIKAYVEGIRVSSGKFVAIIESSDSLSADYVRLMLSRAEDKLSDIVVPRVIAEYNGIKFIHNLTSDLNFGVEDTRDCLLKFFNSGGNSSIWHNYKGLFYRKNKLLEALPLIEKYCDDSLKSNEKILFNICIWHYVSRLDFAENAHYFDKNHDRMKKNKDSMTRHIDSLNIVLKKVITIMSELGTYNQYKSSIMAWITLQAYECIENIRLLPIDNSDKTNLIKSIEFKDVQPGRILVPPQFNEITTKFNNGLEKIKLKIIDKNTKYVSFDIFDTLVMRPFLIPSDLFYLLESKFKKLDKKFRLESFRDIRISSEEIARSINKKNEDVDLGEIYDVMKDVYSVDDIVADRMLKLEIRYEIYFCSQRKTAKELYDLALYSGKKVIVTSDMYLPKNVLASILKKCGYSNYLHLYTSSHHGLMKATQNLYLHIAEALNVNRGEILHIGDNYESDVVSAKNAGWRAAYFPKTTEVVMSIYNKIYSNENNIALNYLGISTAFAVISNNYFDNPFRIFKEETNYNSSPYFLGYFALGLSLLGFTKWMANDFEKKGIESVIFLGRDGYLPMQTYKAYLKKIKLNTKSYYLPTSRKAIIPLSIFNKANIAELKSFNYRGRVTGAIENSLINIRKNESSNLVDDIDFNKARILQEAFVSTYKKYFKGRVAVVDIGYSGRPEQIYAKLFNLPIQTYFFYSRSDEASRRLGDKVNIYSRLNTAGMREKLISEISPSCVAYRISGNKVVPVYETTKDITYYEKYLLSESQRGALNFVDDYLAFFYKHLNELTMADNILCTLPLEQALMNPTSIEKNMFSGIYLEDEIADYESIEVANSHEDSNELDLVGSSENRHVLGAIYGSKEHILQMDQENQNLKAELEKYTSIKWSTRLLAGNIKRNITNRKNKL